MCVATERDNSHLINSASKKCLVLRTYSVESSKLKYLKSFLHPELLSKLDSNIQLPCSVINDLQGCVNLWSGVELHFPSHSFLEIRDTSLAAEFLQVRLTGMNFLCSWPFLKDTRDHNERTVKVLKKYDTLYLRVLRVFSMVSTQNKGKKAATASDLFYTGSSLIVKGIQPIQNDPQSSTKPGVCKQLLTSIQRNRAGSMKRA